MEISKIIALSMNSSANSLHQSQSSFQLFFNFVFPNHIKFNRLKKVCQKVCQTNSMVQTSLGHLTCESTCSITEIQVSACTYLVKQQGYSMSGDRKCGTKGWLQGLAIPSSDGESNLRSTNGRGLDTANDVANQSVYFNRQLVHIGCVDNSKAVLK